MGCTESKPHAEPAQSAVTPFDYDKAQISKSMSVKQQLVWTYHSSLCRDVQLRKDGAKEKQGTLAFPRDECSSTEENSNQNAHSRSW